MVVDCDTERRNHYLHEENVPLGEAIREAVVAHEDAEPGVDETALEARLEGVPIGGLFAESETGSATLQLQLPNVTVSVWGDSPVRIRVGGERA